MNRNLLLVVGTLVVAVLLFGAGWAVKGGRDNAAQAAAKARADSVLQAVTIAHQRAMDSVRTAEAAAIAQASADSAEVARLRALAAGHAANDHARDSLLARARSAADSLPIVVAQRDDARLAYLGAVLADSAARQAATENLARRLAVAEQHRLADSTLAAAQVAGLRALNADLAQQLVSAGEKQKILGFIPKPVCGPGVGVALGAGVTKSATGKIVLGAGGAAGLLPLACIIPL